MCVEQHHAWWYEHICCSRTNVVHFVETGSRWRNIYIYIHIRREQLTHSHMLNHLYDRKATPFCGVSALTKRARMCSICLWHRHVVAAAVGPFCTYSHTHFWETRITTYCSKFSKMHIHILMLPNLQYSGVHIDVLNSFPLVYFTGSLKFDSIIEYRTHHKTITRSFRDILLD